MKHRPTEVRAFVEILEQEHDDVEALAYALLDKALEIKWKRGAYIAIRRLRVEGDHPWPDFLAHGPYPTRKQAKLDIGRRITAKSPGEYAYFALVTDLDATDEPDPDLWTLFDTEGTPDA